MTHGLFRSLSIPSSIFHTVPIILLEWFLVRIPPFLTSSLPASTYALTLAKSPSASTISVLTLAHTYLEEGWNLEAIHALTLAQSTDSPSSSARLYSAIQRVASSSESALRTSVGSSSMLVIIDYHSVFFQPLLHKTQWNLDTAFAHIRSCIASSSDGG